MKSRTFAKIVMGVATAVLIGIDIVLAANSAKGDTYSEIIRDAAHHVATLPWGCGLLMGHWFWNGERVRKWWAWPVAFASLGVLELLNLVWGLGHPLVAFVVGMASGRLAWAMRAP